MLSKFRQRSCETERLDRGDFTPEEYSKWHDEMRVIHRIFGETRALRRTLGRDLEENGAPSISVLDIGAGSGDLLSTVISWRRSGNIFAVGVESSPLAAKELVSADIDALISDGISLPFSDGSFDYVMCSLTLHHFADADAIKLIGEMRRVARERIYIVDLHRSPVAYYFYRIFSRAFLQKFTRDDGALSILRSFKPNELLQLARKAGLTDARVVRSAAYRLVLIG